MLYPYVSLKQSKLSVMKKDNLMHLVRNAIRSFFLEELFIVLSGTITSYSS